MAENAPLGQKRLENAEEEAKEAYLALYGKSPQTIPHTETAFRTQAPHYGILHIAAHTELNYENPLFSRILLRQDDWSDGALEVHEILELDLRKAGLVVLSACNGQWGPDSLGDEIMALNRAFLYAGAATVVASPGRVKDQAARLFMKTFYALLGKHSKADALRLAQLEVRKTYPGPADWAAFVLTGDPGMLGEPSASPEPAGMRIAGLARGTVGSYVTVQTKDRSCIRVRLMPDTRFVQSGKEIGTADSLASAGNLRLVGQLEILATIDQDTVFYATQVELASPESSEVADASGCPAEAPMVAFSTEARAGAPSPGSFKPELGLALPSAGGSRGDTPGGPTTRLPPGSPAAPRNAAAPKTEDPTIIRAREVTHRLIADLPNFRCRQVTTRHTSKDGSTWTVQDKISADVAYSPGDREKPATVGYEKIEYDGKPWKGDIMSFDGYTSSGEFGTTLANLFSPRLAAQFSFAEETQLNGREVFVYNYQVPADNSDWELISESRRCRPAYRGTVWIDKATSWVWRIRHYADEELPLDFPWRSTTLDVSFDYVQIKDLDSFVLPRLAANTMCKRDGSGCRWNLIQFEDYQRFIAKTHIKFDDAASAQPELEPQRALSPAPASQADSGSLIWSGELDALDVLTIESGRAKSGTLSGRAFPGASITITIDPELVIKESPSEQNRWQKLTVQNGPKKIRRIQIDWKSTKQ